jgi:hypothetical protein
MTLDSMMTKFTSIILETKTRNRDLTKTVLAVFAFLLVPIISGWFLYQQIDLKLSTTFLCLVALMFPIICIFWVMSWLKHLKTYNFVQLIMEVNLQLLGIKKIYHRDQGKPLSNDNELQTLQLVDRVNFCRLREYVPFLWSIQFDELRAVSTLGKNLQQLISSIYFNGNRIADATLLAQIAEEAEEFYSQIHKVLTI